MQAREIDFLCGGILQQGRIHGDDPVIRNGEIRYALKSIGGDVKIGVTKNGCAEHGKLLPRILPVFIPIFAVSFAKARLSFDAWLQNRAYLYFFDRADVSLCEVSFPHP